MSAPDAPTLPRFEVGDTVFIEHRRARRGPSGAVITKVGRKWYTVKEQFDDRLSHWEKRYDLATGYADGQGYQSDSRIVTDEILSYEKRRNTAVDKIAPLMDRGTWRSSLTVNQLERIADILEEGQ